MNVYGMGAVIAVAIALALCIGSVSYHRVEIEEKKQTTERLKAGFVYKHHKWSESGAGHWEKEAK